MASWHSARASSLIHLNEAGHFVCKNVPADDLRSWERQFVGLSVMTIANVMVYVDVAQQAEEQVRIARSIAAKFDATLIGVSALAVRPSFVAEGVIIEEVTANDLGKMKADLAQKAKWLQEVAGFPKERIEWRWDIERPLVFLANEARSADLVVIKNTRQQRDDPYRLLDPAEAVLRMGRPTILVPEHVHDLLADRIVVGWKDAREARLAARDALPLLRKATQVTIVEICTSTEQEEARGRVRDVVKYLGRHGIKCETDFRVHLAEPAAFPLMRIAKDLDADLIVTGAYGHSRLGEWFFGGVTRNLLDEAPCCLMMSH
jgi:nucleotide-binding universal stress UspA family protein